MLYKTGVWLISPWNPKARLWLKGRRGLFEKISKTIPKHPSELIWMHCASLGEFEQGRPVIENLKAIYPQSRIIITFFSSSGYEIQKKYPGADAIFYLPVDSAQNARRFLDITQPTLILWVKYEYWYYYLTEIKRRNIPLLLISGIFWKEQLFFKAYGSLYRSMLPCFTHIFVQTVESRGLLNSIGVSENVSISGDTRFDRVIEIAETGEPLLHIKKFCGDFPIIVAGSTWQEDEEELDHFANTHPKIKFIIAPHEIDAPHLLEVKKLFVHSVLYSEFIAKENEGLSANVLIIDNIGMLSRLYKYATITYVGGGFGDDGVHNVIEAAVYGKPVIFGPVYEKFVEAVDLVDCGGAFSIENALELEELLDVLLRSSHEYNKACEASKTYVYAKKGANEKIQQFIREKKLLLSDER